MLLAILLVPLGNATKLGDKEASQYTTNDRFIVITGNITLEASGGSVNVDYPSGFTKDNCVVIASGITYNSAGFRAFGTVQATVSTGARLNSNSITVCCYPASSGQVSPEGTFNYKLVLLKVY